MLNYGTIWNKAKLYGTFLFFFFFLIRTFAQNWCYTAYTVQKCIFCVETTQNEQKQADLYMERAFHSFNNLITFFLIMKEKYINIFGQNLIHKDFLLREQILIKRELYRITVRLSSAVWVLFDIVFTQLAVGPQHVHDVTQVCGKETNYLIIVFL